MDFFTLGIILLVIGALLILAELSVPGFFIAVPGSVLVILGIIYMAMGNIGIVPAVIITISTAIISTIAVMLFYRHFARPSPPATKTIDQLVGKKGIVTVKIEPNTLKGKVRIDNDIWSATAEKEIDAGKEIVVIGGEGVHLLVKEIK